MKASRIYVMENLIYLRAYIGQTQTEFAENVGITRSNVGSYEEGRALPPLVTLVKICEYYGLTVDKMLRNRISFRTMSPPVNIINLRSQKLL